MRDGDRVLVNRLTLWWRPPRPGDIILAEVPIVPGGLTVKRIFAGPGETVSLLAGGAVARVGDGQIAGPFARRLGPDEYYLVGDNRAVSIDSRHFGPVDRRALVGRAWYRYASGETDG
ncbi:MAG: signal peptidase I [Dehalococcoidia bacterium]